MRISGRKISIMIKPTFPPRPPPPPALANASTDTVARLNVIAVITNRNCSLLRLIGIHLHRDPSVSHKEDRPTGAAPSPTSPHLPTCTSPGRAAMRAETMVALSYMLLSLRHTSCPMLRRLGLEH